MRKHSVTIILIGLAIVGAARLIYLSRSGMPQAGDTVRPRLVQEIEWEPGQDGPLWVELAATNESGDSRCLSFATSPKHNPVALVSFYDSAGKPMSPSTVEPSQRC